MFSAFRADGGGVKSLRRTLDQPTRIALGISVAALLVHWGVVVAFLYPRLGQLHFLRLHYTAMQGVDWVDVWYMLLLFPGFATVTLLLNGGIAWLYMRKRKEVGRIILIVTAGLEVLMAIGGTLAVLLNG